MSTTPTNALRELPSVNDLANASALADWRVDVPQTVIVNAARQVIDAARTELLSTASAIAPSLDALIDQVAARLESARRPALGSVINATGIIIHTGLGRSPLAESVVDELADVALNYAPVELDMATGQRGRRSTVVRSLLCELTGAESATVVNNGAAALLIALSTLATGREVIVSRGELIEIGGSFRLPEVMTAGGSVLREGGTTDRTRAGDYAAAISERTAALMKVHPSNFVIAGFSEEASVVELAQLARSPEARSFNRGQPLPVIHDIGSGALTDLSPLGIANEPVARASIEAGANLVIFSGDKLLGGPQTGILVGDGDLIARIEQNPLMRALRVDKLTLAALGATLRLHRDPRRAMMEVPVLAMLATPVAALAERAGRFAAVAAGWPEVRSAEPTDTVVYMGGGSAPTQAIASVAVRIEAAAISADELTARLRSGQPRVVARVQDGAVLLELRTVFPQQDQQLLIALQAALTSR